MKIYLLALLLFKAIAQPPSGIQIEEPQTTHCQSLAAAFRIRPEDIEIVIRTPRLIITKSKQNNSIHVIDSKTGRSVADDVLLVDKDGKVAKIPIYLKPHYQNRGLGTEVKYSVMRYAFEVLGFKKIVDEVYEDNKASNALHIKLGFREVKRAAGVVHYAITAEEFAQVKTQFLPETQDSFRPRRRTF